MNTPIGDERSHSVRKLIDKPYPDERWDGTSRFYGWVRRYTSPTSVLLNLGAGPATKDPRRCLRGEVARVVGADIDPVVKENEELDEAHVYDGGRLPFPGASFDVVLCDYVFEHVSDGPTFLRESARVLRQGGSLFFRTPNRWHQVSLIAMATPQWFHRLVANSARGLGPAAHEPYPTFHRLNSAADIRRAATRAGLDAELEFVEAEPSYLAFHAAAFLLGVAYERLVNRFDALRGLRASITGRLWKH